MRKLRKTLIFVICCELQIWYEYLLPISDRMAIQQEFDRLWKKIGYHSNSGKKTVILQDSAKKW